MEDELSGLRVAFLTSDEGVEQVEVTAPRQMTTLYETDNSYYGAVVVRGGVADGDLLRTASAAVSAVQELYEADGLPAGQRVLVDVVRGQTLTPWPGAQTDVSNAGGNWVATSGQHDARPAFWAALTRLFSGHHQSVEAP